MFHRLLKYGFNKLLKTKWITALIRFIFPDSSVTMRLLGLINDTYKVGSIKNMTRQKHDTFSTKLISQVLNRTYFKVTPDKSF